MFRKAIVPIFLCMALSCATTLSAQENANITNTAQNIHQVAAGETLYSLAKSNGITVQDIIDANPGALDNGLKAGQTIVIPKPSLSETGQTEQESVQSDQTQYMTTHVVKKKETIYRISKQYGITQTDFLNANPQFKYQKLQIGNVVNIPFPSNETSKEQAVETATKKIDAKKVDKKQVAAASDAAEQIITEPAVAQSAIAVSAATIPAVIEQTSLDNAIDTTLFSIFRKHKEPGVIDAALIMPFELGTPQNQNQMKMVEFYQGMLLAIDKMKKNGTSINLHVYDTGKEDESIANILNNDEMEQMDIIFGPKYGKHVNEAVAFASQHDIPIVLPISSNIENHDGNGIVYQLNTAQSDMVTDASKHFFRQFDNPRIIFISTDDNVRNPLIGRLQQDMKAAGQPYVTFKMDFDDRNLAQHLTDSLSASYQNIFVLTSSNGGQLASVLPILQLVTRSKDSSIETHLFGYPEYQIYAYDHMEELFEVDTWFYSWFYTNNRLPESIEFESGFRSAFGRQMMQSYPSYAAYGYDTALYFLSGLTKYGSGLSGHLDRIDTNPVQMGFKFIKDDETGNFINRKVFFVHFSNEYKIEKKDFD